ncbi:hypothetical protein MJI20_28305, partial [Salmonella enterica subsp. enterica serovar Anatum]|nr:hypothetical protein [Salmonella enterica subsp. enterica serovar Anatum]
MSTYVDYKINLLDKNDFTRGAGINTDDIVCPGKSPDSPQWRQHQQEVRHLNQYQTRGAFAYISDDQKVYAR